VDHPSDDIQSELIDLTGISMEDLRHCDRSTLESSLEPLLRQVERPRHNFGSGPPGRVD
jgi:hypothetical protein